MKQPNRYSIRVLYKDGAFNDPNPGLTNYQLAMRRAKEIASEDFVESAWVVTWKPTSVRKVAA